MTRNPTQKRYSTITNTILFDFLYGLAIKMQITNYIEHLFKVSSINFKNRNNLIANSAGIGCKPIGRKLQKYEHQKWITYHQ